MTWSNCFGPSIRFLTSGRPTRSMRTEKLPAGQRLGDDGDQPDAPPSTARSRARRRGRGRSCRRGRSSRVGERAAARRDRPERGRGVEDERVPAQARRRRGRRPPSPPCSSPDDERRRRRPSGSVQRTACCRRLPRSRASKTQSTTSSSRAAPNGAGSPRRRCVSGPQPEAVDERVGEARRPAGANGSVFITSTSVPAAPDSGTRRRR